MRFSALALLRLITWPYVRKHLFRCLLTTAGIVLGVAVFVGMHTANRSVLFAFNQTVDRIAGSTQLQVSAGEVGFPESVLEKVQASPLVEAAAPVVESSVQTGIAGQGNLLIIGVDMTGDRSLRKYDLEGEGDDVVDDPLIFLAQPDSLIITTSFSQTAGLKINDKLTMRTMEGPKQFTVRGIMKAGGLASAFGGNLAIMDVYAAQLVFGRGRMFDRIDIRLREGIDLNQAREQLQKMVGAGLMVEPPSARGQQFEAMSRVYSMTANISSLFALFIGLFLIYNTFSIAVTQRRAEIGILRALAATQGQIRGLFILESALAGLFGSLLGLAGGVVMARGLAAYLSTMFSEIYGVGQKAEEVAAEPGLLLAALAIGVVTSIIAGWLPARSAAAVDPVKALQKGRVQVLSEGENRARRWVAVALAVVAVLCVLFGHQAAFFYLGYLLSIIAAVLLTPWLCIWLTMTFRPVLKALRPVEGALTADSLLDAPRRTSGTVAALTLSLSLVIGLAGVSRSSYNSILAWVDSALNPDLFVTSGESITQRSFRFPPSMEAELAAIPGVEEVQAVRTPRILYQGTPVMLVGAPIDRLSKRIKVRSVAGDPNEMVRLTAAGDGAMISDNFATLHRIRLGDMLELPAPDGLFRLRVVGINEDYSDQQGAILIDRSLYNRVWKDETSNVFRIYLRRGQDAAAVRQMILDRLGGRSRLFVLTNDELRRFVMHLTEQWFGITYVQIFVAVLVAVLGIVNTLTVSIADRRRELGVLQAVGALRNQVRGAIWMEAATISALGLVLGYALGAFNLYYILEVTRRDLAGLRLDYRYPVETAAALIPVMLAVAWLAALGPGESAVRGSLVEALEYE